MESLNKIGLDNLIIVLILFLIDIGFCVVSFISAEIIQYFELKYKYSIILIITLICCLIVLVFVNYSILIGGIK